MENQKNRKRILVGVNTLTSVSRAVYSNHCQFWYRLGRSYPDFDFILCHPERMAIDNMRNMAAKVALENDVDYILFIDDDVLVPLDTLGRLLACDADIAAGWTLIRGYPYKNMFFKFIGDDKRALQNWQEPVKNDRGLFEVDAVGFSCCLIKVEHMKKIPQPYFVTGPFNTEDVYYCLKARYEIPETTIVVDPMVMTAHKLGDEFIDPITKGAYKNYFETLYPDAPKGVDVPDKSPLQKIDSGIEGGRSYEDMLEELYRTPV